METDPDGSGMRRWITLMELREEREDAPPALFQNNLVSICFPLGREEGCGAPQSVEFFPKQIC